MCVGVCEGVVVLPSGLFERRRVFSCILAYAPHLLLPPLVAAGFGLPWYAWTLLCSGLGVSIF